MKTYIINNESETTSLQQVLVATEQEIMQIPSIKTFKKIDLETEPKGSPVLLVLFGLCVCLLSVSFITDKPVGQILSMIF